MQSHDTESMFFNWMSCIIICTSIQNLEMLAVFKNKYTDKKLYSKHDPILKWVLIQSYMFFLYQTNFSNENHTPECRICHFLKLSFLDLVKHFNMKPTIQALLSLELKMTLCVTIKIPVPLRWRFPSILLSHSMEGKGSSGTWGEYHLHYSWPAANALECSTKIRSHSQLLNTLFSLHQETICDPTHFSSCTLFCSKSPKYP